MSQIGIACEKLFESGFLPSEAAMNPAEYFMIVGVKVNTFGSVSGAVVKIKKEMCGQRALVELNSVLHEISIELELSIIGYSMQD